MSEFIVSARKYRPATFASVVGQQSITSTLKNAIERGQLAHAYLFCGPRGVGKTTCARIFAKAINCLHPAGAEACNECESCRAFNEGRSLNIHELDAASNNSVDDIRSLTDQVRIPPQVGRYSVYIIDEVHMLSVQAFNAFLKTLEEPPAHAVFILATTEKHKIIPTILSRCQIYDFHRITVGDIADHLEYVAAQEGYTTERAALNVIAQKADGAMRDALSIFDQVAASSRGNITYQSTIDNLNVLDERYFSRLYEAFRKADVAEALMVYKEVREHGFDSHFFINGLAQYLRNLMVARDPRTLSLLDADEAVKQQMAAQAAELTPEFFYASMSLCNEADLAYRQASDKTFLVELLLIKLCQLNGPSPIFSGDGEGQKLQKIEVNPAYSQAPATPQPSAAPVQPQAVRTTVQTAPAAAPAARPQTQPIQYPATPAPAAPVSSATPSAAASQRTIRRTAATRGHVSIASVFAEKETEQASGPAVTAPKRRQPFTDAQLMQQWGAFINAHPKEHILVNTMRAHSPAHIEGEETETYLVTVVNIGQVELLNEVKPRLLKFLRDALSNDYLDLRFNYDESAISPTAWNDRDVLAHLVEHSPHVAELISAFKFTL